MAPTFKDWLARARLSEGPAGDLIRDLQQDPDLPELFRSLEHMRVYLRLRNACPEAVAVAPVVWGRYRNWFNRLTDSAFRAREAERRREWRADPEVRARQAERRA